VRGGRVKGVGGNVNRGGGEGGRGGGGGGLFSLHEFVPGSLYVNSDLHCRSRSARSRAPRFACIACSNV